MAGFSLDVTAADFDLQVVQKSNRLPVIVDFWAPWCAPCRTLKPLLEKLSTEYAGRFLLATVNTEEEPELATRYGVRSIPHVAAIVDGEVLEQFTGALPERDLRRFIEGVLPSPAQHIVDAAERAVEAEDPVGATILLRKALKIDPTHLAARQQLASLLAEQHKHEEALALLKEVRIWPAEMEGAVTALQARLQLAGRAGKGDSAELELRLSTNPEDHEARLALASLQANEGAYEAAIENLLEIIARDRHFADDAARKTLLQLFDVLGGSHPLTRSARSRLAGLLNR